MPTELHSWFIASTLAIWALAWVFLLSSWRLRARAAHLLAEADARLNEATMVREEWKRIVRTAAVDADLAKRIKAQVSAPTCAHTAKINGADGRLFCAFCGDELTKKSDA